MTERRRTSTRRAARAVLGLALLAVVTALGPQAARAQDVEAPEVAPVLRELGLAWARRDVAGVVALFAPDGVIQLDPTNPNGSEQYRAGGGVGLGPGVRVLMGEGEPVGPEVVREPAAGPRGAIPRRTTEGVHLAVAGSTTTAITGAGAPATLVRWGYRKVGMRVPPPLVSLPPVPPETGRDELVIRAGRIASYTRAPDPASVEARRRALAAAADVQTGQPTPVDPLYRRTPTVGPWIVALGVGLAGVVLLALLKRPPEAP